MGFALVTFSCQRPPRRAQMSSWYDLLCTRDKHVLGFTLKKAGADIRTVDVSQSLDRVPISWWP